MGQYIQTLVVGYEAFAALVGVFYESGGGDVEGELFVLWGF